MITSVDTEGIWQNPTLFHRKHIPQSGDRTELLQPDKGRL